MPAFSKLITGACALLSLTQAAPIVVTVTDVVTVTTWTTLNCTTTVYLPSSESPASTTSSLVEQSKGAQFAAAAAPSPATTPASVSSAVSVATTSIPVAAAVVQQPTTTLQTVSTSGAAPRSDSAASSGGQCEGTACTGDITHWDGGLGACGWDVNTASDMQIALPVGLMGAQSNGNPYCGRSVTLKDPTTGVTVQATVGDKCMGCVGTAIDCTNAVFNAVTSGQGDGRVSGIQWWFN